VSLDGQPICVNQFSDQELSTLSSAFGQMPLDPSGPKTICVVQDGTVHYYQQNQGNALQNFMLYRIFTEQGYHWAAYTALLGGDSNDIANALVMEHLMARSNNLNDNRMYSIYDRTNNGYWERSTRPQVVQKVVINNVQINNQPAVPYNKPTAKAPADATPLPKSSDKVADIATDSSSGKSITKEEPGVKASDKLKGAKVVRPPSVRIVTGAQTANIPPKATATTPAAKPTTPVATAPTTSSKATATTTNSQSKAPTVQSSAPKPQGATVQKPASAGTSKR
jgi:hypothetical protein